ncbi:terpene synthase family protein [Nocardia terpenica]|uniref:terpene synthase family protein n=1 Tax=Nocardia terpenica TaxID=455432 RepID=UPI0012FDC6E2|nr:terpene synthase family protein [Nocardia terpenica]
MATLPVENADIRSYLPTGPVGIGASKVRISDILPEYSLPGRSSIPNERPLEELNGANGSNDGNGQSISIPTVEMPLPNYGLSSTMAFVEHDTWQWLNRHHLLVNDAAREHIVRTRPQYTTAKYWPRADQSHARACNWYTAWAFIVDDALDDAITVHDHATVESITNDLIEVAYGRQPCNDAGRSLREILDTFSQRRSDDWRVLLGDTHADWLNTYPVESRANSLDRRMEFTEYMPHRASGVNERIFLHLNEYVRDIELPSVIRMLPAMVRARDRAVEWVGLYNDVYSFAKEAAVGYRYNAVAVVRDQRNCVPQEAANTVCGVLSGLIREFQEACAAVPAQVRAVAGNDRQLLGTVLQVLDGYRHTVRGNFDYHIGTPRYTTVQTYMPLNQLNEQRPSWSSADIFVPNCSSPLGPLLRSGRKLQV